MSESDTNTATIEDVGDDVAEAPREVQDSAAELVHDGAEESEHRAEEARDTASDIASSTADVVADVSHEAREHAMHAETRDLVARGFERIEQRLGEVERHVGIGVTAPVEEMAETPPAIVETATAPDHSEETTEVHAKRRRVFARGRRT